MQRSFGEGLEHENRTLKEGGGRRGAGGEEKVMMVLFITGDGDASVTTAKLLDDMYDMMNQSGEGIL